jgi:phosphoribosylformimino-5-aminoimidazole carboxamide ribotide isomerase
MGLYGVIIGKAYYAGTIDLAQAVQAGGDQSC